MPKSYAEVYLHVVFSTKDRPPFLQDAMIRSDLFAYLGGICHGKVDCPSIAIGGHVDHVHSLVRLGRLTAIADLVRDLKRDSSPWLKQKGLASFAWHRGYGAFSVSPGHVGEVVAYIAGQEEHHKKVTYQDEFRRICRKYGVQLDEEYAWD